MFYRYTATPPFCRVQAPSMTFLRVANVSAEPVIFNPSKGCVSRDKKVLRESKM